MSFNVSLADWEKTPQSVKDYVVELQLNIRRLQNELNRYLPQVVDKSVQGLEFNGLTDFLVTPYPLEISTEAFTFEAKILVNGNRSGEFKIIHVYGPDQIQHAQDWVQGPPINVAWLSYQWGGVWWGIVDEKGVFHAIHSGAARSGDVMPPQQFMDGNDSVTVNEWHHIVGTWDGDMIKLYIDGELRNSKVFAGNVILATQAYIGAHFSGTSQLFPGWMEDVRIWNRCLDLEEIKSHGMNHVCKNEEQLVINYCSQQEPIKVGKSGAQVDWQTVDSLENKLTKERLSSAQARLIEDLKLHLLDLEQRNQG